MGIQRATVTLVAMVFVCMASGFAGPGAGLRIVGPTDGAVVWGQFAVGVEVSRLAHADLEVQLGLSSGPLLSPKKVEQGADGMRRVLFVVDAEQLAPGTLELTAVGLTAGAPLMRSATIELTVVHPDAGAVFLGECEDFGAEGTGAAAARPESFGSEPPYVGSRADASGGAFVTNLGVNPVWFVPYDVPETGRYQMMVVARGDQAAGAFPSICLSVDAPDDCRTAARLIDRAWHRIPVGFPIELEAGPRRLALRFLNDFNRPNAANRALHLDRFEILRVRDDGPDMGYGAMAMMAAFGARKMEAGAESGGLRIGTQRAIDGLPVNGRLQIDARCRWEGMEQVPAPTIDLLVNDRAVASQQATQATFAIDRSALEPGPNRVRLVATLPDGRGGSTPEEVVYVSGEPQPTAAPRDLHRFSVVDQRWSPELREMWSALGEEEGHRVARLSPSRVARLALPTELEGEFDVLVEARGPGAPAVGLFDLGLEIPDQPVTGIGQARVQNWWNFHAAGSVSLAPGPKTLTLQLADGSHAASNDKEALLLRSVLLRSQRVAPDRGAPRATVLYPQPGHVAYGADAVIVEAWDDDDRLSLGELWIDGVASGNYAQVPNGVGWLVFPLILRNLAPGEHVLSVRIEDRAGNIGESLEIPFSVAAEPPSALGQYDRAVRLLSRFAYGPEPQQLAALLLSDEREWLATQLAERGAGDVSAHAHALAEMQNFYDYAVERAAIQHAIGTRNPVWARFVGWSENHFSTWIRKSGGGSEWREHEMFLELGPAPFKELLFASATSPAMLVYLDQRSSYAGGLNENYAREVLELHTVGVDAGYTQSDVTELASLLAGLTLAEEAPLSGVGGMLVRELRYAPDLGDGAARTILGTHFDPAAPAQRWERLRSAIDLLATHPSTARFVSTKLAEHYVSSPPPADLVNELTDVFVATAGDLRAVLLAILEHPAFFDPELGPRAMSPMDFAFNLARASGHPSVHWGVHSYLQRAGMEYFGCATPDGYSEEDVAWTDTNAVMQRWSLPREVHWSVTALIPNQHRQGAGGDVAAWRQRVVDAAAVSVTGHLLGPASNRAALEFFAALEGNPWEQVNEVALLVCQLPEAGLEW